MPDKVVGTIPQFSSDESVVNEEEVKEIYEKETQSEPPAEDKPTTIEQPASGGEDTGSGQDVQTLVKEQVERATLGLRTEIVALREKLADARTVAEQRQIGQQIEQVKDDIDELQDLNPEDVSVVDRILRSKGYITKSEADKMFYDSVKQQTISEFLEKHPEYKPDNDPGDTKWATLQREVSLYKMPDDPKFIETILERAHKAIANKPSGDRDIPVKRQQLKTASVGSGGVQRSSAQNRLTEEQRQRLLQGGWSEADIKAIEK